MKPLSRYLYPLQLRQAPPGDAYVCSNITNNSSRGIMLRLDISEEDVIAYVGGEPLPTSWLKYHRKILLGLPLGRYDAFSPGHDLTDLTMRRQVDASIIIFDRQSPTSFAHRVKILQELPVDNKKVKIATWRFTTNYVAKPGSVIAHSTGEWDIQPDVFLSYFPANETHGFVLQGLEDGDLLKCETLDGHRILLSGAFIKEKNNLSTIKRGYQIIHITFNAT